MTKDERTSKIYTFPQPINRARIADTRESRRPPEELAAARLNERARLAASQFSDRAWPMAVVSAAIWVVEFLGLSVVGTSVAVSINLLPVLGDGTDILVLLAILVLVEGLLRPKGSKLLTEVMPTLWSMTAAMVAVMAVVFVMALPHHLLHAANFGRLVFWVAVEMLAWCGLRLVEAASVRALQFAGKLQRRAVVVGGGEPAAELIRHLGQSGDNHILICGIFDDRLDERAPEWIEGVPHLGTVDELVEFGRIARIELLIVTIPFTAEDRLLALLKKLWVLPADIRLSTLNTRLQFARRTYSFVGSVPCLSLFDKPIDGWGEIAKRLFDLVFAAVALVLLAPLMIGVAIAVKLSSPGPVIFRQKRYGFNNAETEVYKFRSMYDHLADPQAKVVVTRNDPRVTRVGRFIRKTSIDELPQLFNVLQGRLSLVGPRPHAVNAHTHNQIWEEVVEGYFARHKVKPGITGWAQINGYRGEVDNREKIVARVAHDLYYIENWSILFDLYILLRTPFHVLAGKSAY